jgi:hypothetical protein
MKHQGYNSRLDESLGMKHKGKHSQSMKDRRDESKGMAKRMGDNAYGGDKSMPASIKAHLSKLIKK